jgi:hypothetical protein
VVPNNLMPKGKFAWFGYSVLIILFLVIVFFLASAALLSLLKNVDPQTLTPIPLAIGAIPIVVGIIGLIRGWGKTIFDVWPEAQYVHTEDAPKGEICLTCGGRGKTGSTYTYGDKSAYVCNQCLQLVQRDKKIIHIAILSFGVIFVLFGLLLIYTASYVGQGGREIISQTMTETELTTTYRDVQPNPWAPVLSYVCGAGIIFLLGPATIMLGIGQLRKPQTESEIGSEILHIAPEDRWYWWNKANKK